MATHAETVEAVQIERLGGDTLSCQGGVSVNQKRQYSPASPLAKPVLAGPGPARHDRVHRLEMAGIRHKVNADLLA
jgi:hypothetical protein